MIRRGSVLPFTCGLLLVALTLDAQPQETITKEAVMNSSKESPSVVGTFEYVLEDMEGMSIITETHVIWVLSNKNRKPFQGEQPTDAEKAAAFDGSGANAGTYEFVGPSRITVHRLFSTNPNFVGQEFTWEYEFEGELCKYWILQPDGSRGPMGMARRIRK